MDKMNMHLKILYKAVKVVIALVISFYLLFFGILAIAKFAQWRVDVNMERERMERVVGHDKGFY